MWGSETRREIWPPHCSSRGLTYFCFMIHDICLEAFYQNPESYKFFGSELKNDEDFAFEVVREDGLTL